MTQQDRTAVQYHKMTETPIPRLILSLAAPTILSMLITSIYNLADTFFVGRISTSASGAVGVVSSLMAIIQALGFMLGHGSGTIISRRLGSQDTHAATRFASTSFFTALAFGVVLAVVGLATLPDFMMLLGSTETILPHACAYARPILLAAPLMISSLVMNNILRYEGKANLAMIGLVTGGLLNIALDPLFIFGLDMGITGAALATILAQFISFFLCAGRLLTTKEEYRVSIKKIGFNWPMLRLIVNYGLPSGLQNSVIAIANVVVQANINSFGKMAVAGCGAYAKIEGFAFLPITSFSMAATTFVGQNFGAGRPDRVKKGMWVTVILSLIYTVMTGALLLMFQGPILHLFTADETVVTFGQIAMHYFCPFYWLLGILHGLAGTVRGTGKSVPPMVVLLVSLCLFRIVWIRFALQFFRGIEGVFLLYPVSWGFGAVLMILYTWKGRWRQT